MGYLRRGRRGGRRRGRGRNRRRNRELPHRNDVAVDVLTYRALDHARLAGGCQNTDVALHRSGNATVQLALHAFAHCPKGGSKRKGKDRHFMCGCHRSPQVSHAVAMAASRVKAHDSPGR